ncbi:MAG: hypothetical protein L6455_13440 [Kiritimatiellae bacterium]|nr:hypothetical protein [Verrucomicrobiota bacterium]MCG2680947.1 hypothetical protein [Kiritimatiellia bacterium]
MAGVDVLIVVEDPGAANFIVELPVALERAGISCRVLAYGHARKFLCDREVGFNEPSQGDGPGKIIDSFLPRLLLVGTSQNSDSPALMLVEEARRRGISTAGFVDMAVDASLRFSGRSGNPLMYAPEHLIVPDKVTQEAFQNLGFPAERIVVCGHPAYDRVRKRAHELATQDIAALRARLLGLNPAPRPVWLFAAEHVDGCEYRRMHRGPGYTLNGRGSSDRRTNIVLEEVLDVAALMSPRPFVILRLHPKNTREEFSAYLSEVDFLSIGGDPMDLVWVSDLVIGLSSMLIMEAVHMGRPTLSVVPREEEKFWAPSVVQGLTPGVSTRAALRERIMKPGLSAEYGIPGNTVMDAVQSLSDAIEALLLRPRVSSEPSPLKIQIGRASCP